MSDKAIIEQPANQKAVVGAATLALPELWSKQAIKDDQDSIRTDALSISARIHANAVMCLRHAEKFGDTSLMRRLIIDTLGKNTRDTAVRVTGLIGWMRLWSPMELNGDVINLSGTLEDGVTKRPFRIADANASPFWTDRRLDEMPLKPLYRDNLVSKFSVGVKQFREAMKNTVLKDGKPTPIDPKKPFFDGIHTDRVEAAIKTIEEGVVQLANFRDSTKVAREAALAKAKADADLEEATREVVEDTAAVA